MLLEQGRADKRQLAQAGHGVIHMHVQLFAHVSHADKGRKAAAEQADGQAGGVLVGVQPDHQQAKQGRPQRAGHCAGRKSQPGVAGVKAHGKAHHGGHQHHAFGAQVDHTDFFIDQQTQTGQRQRRAGRQGGCDQQGKFIHAPTFLRMR